MKKLLYYVFISSCLLSIYQNYSMDPRTEEANWYSLPAEVKAEIFDWTISSFNNKPRIYSSKNKSVQKQPDHIQTTQDILHLYKNLRLIDQTSNSLMQESQLKKTTAKTIASKLTTSEGIKNQNETLLKSLATGKNDQVKKILNCDVFYQKLHRKLSDNKNIDQLLTQKSCDGDSSFIVAALNNNYEGMLQLCNHKRTLALPDHILNSKGNKQIGARTALHYAALHNNLRMVRLLLEHGADPRIKDNQRKKPCDYVPSNKNSSLIVRELIDGEKAAFEKEKRQVTQFKQFKRANDRYEAQELRNIEVTFKQKDCFQNA